MESKSMNIDAVKKISKKRKRSSTKAVAKHASKAGSSEPAIELKENQDNSESPQAELKGMSMNEIEERFPVLKNDELVQKFLAVPLTNNQKGRIRQVLKDNLKDTSELLLPDVIHNKIQGILKNTNTITDSELRKIRILYNMLKTALANEKKTLEKKTADRKILKSGLNKEKEVKVKKVKEEKVYKEVIGEDKKEKKDGVKKEKGKKRYVVFLGNLPLEVDKDMIMKHFSEMNEHIVDIRIPKKHEEKKSAIAYVELKNEPTYELALSKHHSMMGKKRIKVLYTTQKNGKITEAQAKSKAAKMLALQKSGKLIGSTPLGRKRSQRRLRMKQARKRAEGDTVA